MTSFDFNEAITEWQPTGEHEYIFKRLCSEDTTIVRGNSRDEAWEAIYHYKGDDWHSWALLGRKDIVEMLNRTDPVEVSVNYGQRNDGHPDVPVAEQ